MEKLAWFDVFGQAAFTAYPSGESRADAWSVGCRFDDARRCGASAGGDASEGDGRARWRHICRAIHRSGLVEVGGVVVSSPCRCSAASTCASIRR